MGLPVRQLARFGSPLASMEKETLILGTPRGAGGMPAGQGLALSDAC